MAGGSIYVRLNVETVWLLGGGMGLEEARAKVGLHAEDVSECMRSPFITGGYQCFRYLR